MPRAGRSLRRRRPERGLARLAGCEAFVRKLPSWGDQQLSSGSRRHFRVETWSFTRKCVSVECFTDFLWVFLQFRYLGISAGRTRGTRSATSSRLRSLQGLLRGSPWCSPLEPTLCSLPCSLLCSSSHRFTSHQSWLQFEPAALRTTNFRHEF